MPLDSDRRLPPNQRLAAPGRWPVVGEKGPRDGDASPWTLSIGGAVNAPTRWGLDALLARPLQEFTVDIHCVTRWSRLGVRFRGLALEPLVRGCDPCAMARFAWMQARSDREHGTSLPLDVLFAAGAFLAFEADGSPLAPIHGGPMRIVVPGRYFYKSVKWIERIELLESDRLGWWERGAGYHNGADPWREERYAPFAGDRAKAVEALENRDLSGGDWRGIEASGLSLGGLNAERAALRDARFEGADLSGARFRAANLSNARLRGANLRDADFRDADVEGADFDQADLRGADFRGASLFGTTFDGAHKADARFDPEPTE
ncbi:MAG: molybdopterin-dependent oxidoreductase [Armatimonadota bacterium]